MAIKGIYLDIEDEGEKLFQKTKLAETSSKMSDQNSAVVAQSYEMDYSLQKNISPSAVDLVSAVSKVKGAQKGKMGGKICSTPQNYDNQFLSS